MKNGIPDLKFGLVGIIIFMVVVSICFSIGFDRLKSDVSELKLAIEKIDNRAFEIKINLDKILFNDPFNYDRLKRIEQKLDENRKKDIAYTNKVVDVRNYNVNLFYNLLKEIKDNKVGIVQKQYLLDRFNDQVDYIKEDMWHCEWSKGNIIGKMHVFNELLEVFFDISKRQEVYDMSKILIDSQGFLNNLK